MRKGVGKEEERADIIIRARGGSGIEGRGGRRCSHFSFSSSEAQAGLAAAQILLITSCVESSTALGAWGNMLLPGFAGRG